MPVDQTPPVDAIDWRVDPDRLAQRLFEPDVWPTVYAWLLDLQAAHEAKQAALTEEERQRRLNQTERDRIDAAIAKDREKRRRAWRERTRR